MLGSDVTEIIIPRDGRKDLKVHPMALQLNLAGLSLETYQDIIVLAVNSLFTLSISLRLKIEETDELVKTWWKTESFGCKYSKERRCREDEMVLESLGKTTRKVDERYKVGLI